MFRIKQLCSTQRNLSIPHIYWFTEYIRKNTTKRCRVFSSDIIKLEACLRNRCAGTTGQWLRRPRNMQTITIISSSPPRVFARSPTPIASSSPSLPSPDSLLHPERSPRRRFKLSGTVRDGFGSGSTSAKTLLRPKFTAENVPVSSQRSLSTEAIKIDKSSLSQSRPIHNAALRVQEIQETAGRSSIGSCSIRSTSVAYGQDGKTDTVGASNGKCLPIADGLLVQGHEDSADSQLLFEKAVPRRLDWTPTKDSTHIEASTSPVEGITNFASILGSFTYKADSTSKAGNVQRQPFSEAPTKRRKIDLVSDDAQPPANKHPAPRLLARESSTTSRSSERRSKSPKKKSTTITARATSQYFTEEEPEATPLMQYLTVGETNEVTAEETNSKPKAKRPAAKARQTKKKKEPEVILLSPQSAIKQYEGQELLFGSASQIAGDESPVLLRNTIQAIKESEASFSSTNASSADTARISTTSDQRRISSFIGSRNLWTVSTRDTDDSLLQVETVDLSKSPAAREEPIGASEKRDTVALSEQQEDVFITNRNDEWLDVDIVKQETTNRSMETAPKPSLILTAGRSSRPQSTSPIRQIHIAAQPEAEIDSKSSQDDAEVRTNRGHSMDDRAPRIEYTASAGAIPSATSRPPKPLFTGMTTGELSSQLKSYGFKPVKKRDKMIELLERCWNDQNNPTGEGPDEPPPPENRHSDILSSVYDISSRPTPKPKKPRGRPKKDTAASTSEKTTATTEKTKSPTKKRKKTTSESAATSSSKKESPASKKKKEAPTKADPPPPLALPTDPIEDEDLPAPPPAPTPPSSNPDLSAQITAAIRAQTTTNPRTDPTYHEKILMYDPIVLEDLTAWLNTEGFRAVREDREVGVLEVRDWCERRGVTCLGVGGGWRGNGKASGG